MRDTSVEERVWGWRAKKVMKQQRGNRTVNCTTSTHVDSDTFLPKPAWSAGAVSVAFTIPAYKTGAVMLKPCTTQLRDEHVRGYVVVYHKGELSYINPHNTFICSDQRAAVEK